MFKQVGIYSLILDVTGVLVFIFGVFQKAPREYMMFSLSFCLFGGLVSIIALWTDTKKAVPFISLFLSIIPYVVTFLLQK